MLKSVRNILVSALLLRDHFISTNTTTVLYINVTERQTDGRTDDLHGIPCSALHALRGNYHSVDMMMHTVQVIDL